MEDKLWVETCCDKFGRQKVSHKRYFLLKSLVWDRFCAALQRPLLSVLLLHKLATLPVWQTELKKHWIHFPELISHLINPDWDMDQELYVMHSAHRKTSRSTCAVLSTNGHVSVSLSVTDMKTWAELVSLLPFCLFQSRDFRYQHTWRSACGAPCCLTVELAHPNRMWDSPAGTPQRSTWRVSCNFPIRPTRVVSSEGTLIS